jgi:hypothetical protein
VKKRTDGRWNVNWQRMTFSEELSEYDNEVLIFV